MLKIGFKTDLGNVREKNEDALLIAAKHSVFVVADGVGGQSSGEIASRRAINGIESYLQDHSIYEADSQKDKEKWLSDYFISCFDHVNKDIRRSAAGDPQKEGMATTAVLMHIKDKTVYIANIGDSRAYLIRDSKITQITEDHTYVNSLVQTGDITKNEAAEHPQKNIITKALGTDENAVPDLYHVEVRKKDRILLCTDGLHGELSDDEILEYIVEEKDLNKVCNKLVASAKEKGGRDNITVICIEI